MIKEIIALFRDLLNVIRKRKRELIIVEVKQGGRLPELTQELVGSITTLAQHPGFEFLLTKLRVQREMMLAKLVGERFEKLADAEFLQSGVFWTGWLDGQLRQAVYKTTTLHSGASAERQEKDLFAQLPTIEEVGSNEG